VGRDSPPATTPFLVPNSPKKYIGCAEAQLKRMQGLRGIRKHGQRPEIIDRFGYDTKAAIHTLWLLYEGIELMQDHCVTLPRPTRERELLLESASRRMVGGSGHPASQPPTEESRRIFGRVELA